MGVAVKRSESRDLSSLLSLFFAVILRGCDFSDFARKSTLKRIELHDEIRVFRNKITLSERSEESLFGFSFATQYGGKLIDSSLNCTHSVTSFVLLCLAISLSSGKGWYGLSRTLISTPDPPRRCSVFITRKLLIGP